jgi:hypothetical protein
MKNQNESKTTFESMGHGEGHHLALNPNWTCEIEGETIPLALHIEVIDMKDATGEPEFKDYPFLASISIVAANPHKSFDESNDGDAEGLSLVMDAVGYMGGVPVDDKFLSLDKLNQDATGELKAKVAKLVTRSYDYGTTAAREGAGASLTYPQFKTGEAAHKWAVEMIQNYGDVLMGIQVGFILDQPINMAGNDGWETIRKMVEGRK